MTGDVSGDLTGRRLGNYRIDGVLGKGGMSVMYKATDVRLGRKVALKVIGEHLGADAEFRERFVDEARNTSAIDHANVVPLYDFGEIEGMHYIAMRLVDGADLASLISQGPISPERALSLLDQVGDALDSLHNRGLVHLDVKPANVLVTSRESAREHVYVADFGLTRRGATGHRTRGGDFLGSPTYAAPEHLRGEPLDGRTDQYALACVLFACLTGGPPYKGDVPTVIKGHLANDPPSVARTVGLPPAIDDVIRKGMAKNPADRYDNCGELISAARKALGPAAPGAATVRTEVTPVNQWQPGQPGQPGQQGQSGPQPGEQSGPQSWGRPAQGPESQPTPAQQPGSPWAQDSQPTVAQPHPLRPPGQQPPQSPQQPPGWGRPQQPGPQQPGQQLPQPGQPFSPAGYQPSGYTHDSGYTPGPGFHSPPYGAPQQQAPPHGFAGYGQLPQGGFPQPQKAKGGSLRWLWITVALIVVAGGIVLAVVLLNRGGDAQPTAPEIPVGPASGAPSGQPSGGAPPPSVSVRPTG